MSSFPILDLVVGMIFLYFLLSIICSSAVEVAMTVSKARAKILKAWICKIFDEEVIQKDDSKISLGQAIINHCAVTVLSDKGASPSYIDAKNFTAALLEKITYNPNDPASVATNINTIIHAIENTTLLSNELKRAFLSYAFDARDTYRAISIKTVSQVEYFKLKIENWFDTSMDRLTGTLKKKYSRPFTIWIAIVSVALLNADSIAIARYLYTNPAVRTQFAAQAQLVTKDSILMKRLDEIKASNRDTSKDAIVGQLQATLRKEMANMSEAKTIVTSALPLGWIGAGAIPSTVGGVITKIIGLTATIFAIIMGAPFWFDILNKIANLRSTGPKPPSTAGNFDGKERRDLS